jgi:hypothetical protein
LLNYSVIEEIPPFDINSHLNRDIRANINELIQGGEYAGETRTVIIDGEERRVRVHTIPLTDLPYSLSESIADEFNRSINNR